MVSKGGQAMDFLRKSKHYLALMLSIFWLMLLASIQAVMNPTQTLNGKHEMGTLKDYC